MWAYWHGIPPNFSDAHWSCDVKSGVWQMVFVIKVYKLPKVDVNGIQSSKSHGRSSWWHKALYVQILKWKALRDFLNPVYAFLIVCKHVNSWYQSFWGWQWRRIGRYAFRYGCRRGYESSRLLLALFKWVVASCVTNLSIKPTMLLG